LTYAPGPILCRVKCGGEIVRGDDKLVCTERTIIARIDATEGLRYFARMQALSVINNYPEPNDVVLDWLMTGDEETRIAAYSAAYSAVNAAYSAAYSTAYSAASAASAADSAASAAYSAADSAARSAAYSAADSAARSAAYSAARWAQLVNEAFEGVL
jgi:hypothetical protein